MRRANHLISEKSPYLLQHAYNPVQWYPWGDEAFERAKREDKPIFLSVGYSTCHWCHVMAHESFEDPEVAALMNKTFICIKVDREERPDIDNTYMAIAQAMTGRGGWPLTIIMTPDKKPIFAATYIPKRGRFGQMGMMELVPRIHTLWESNREELLASADKVLEAFSQTQAPAMTSEKLELDAILARGYDGLSANYDALNGGFGTAPKFPSPSNLLFLLRYWKRRGDDVVLDMVKTTLLSMRMGGIYDHVGGGFHRYSTDERWLVPHFEKMLYDQAMLAIAYVEAFQATGEEEFARTAREILDYVLRDMTSETGGFFSAEDADSEGEEGKYYLWTADELKSALEKEEMRLMIRLFDVHESGNFERGRNILRLRSAPQEAASVLKMDEKELRNRLEKIRLKLFAVREKRIRPMRDDKILTDWNGLMIAAFARAAQVLHEPKYASAAMRSADFLLKEMRTAEWRLLHRYRGEAGIQANLDDYAFLIWGLIDLYETVFDMKYLQAALELNQVMLQHFLDDQQGGLFFTPDEGDAILLRKKEFYDGAVPSGNSVAMLNLLRLAHFTGDLALQEASEKIARAAVSAAGNRPTGYAMLLCALDFALGPSIEIVLAGDRDDEEIQKMLQAIRVRFLPNKVVLMRSDEQIGKVAKFAKILSQLDGRATAYVCSGQRCHLPTTDLKKMLDLLAKSGE
ncbi:MAG: thioredoxin domain-containing protein [Methanothrix sp.]|nr:thioredoxin domain-containing protein [Methanothrix sp.]